MAETTRSDHDTIDGDSYDPSALLGGFMAAMGNLYIGSLDAQVAGYCHLVWMDMIDSLLRRLINTFAGYVYLDDTDDDLEFSVTAATFEYRGLTCTYAGEVNIAGLVAATARVIYFDLSLAPTVTVGVAAAWPTTPHIKLAIITPPATGHWLDQHRVRHVSEHAVCPHGGGVYSFIKAFAYNTSTPVTVGTVPPNARVLRTYIVIETVFDGTAPTLSLGDVGNVARLMATTDNDPKTLGSYGATPMYKYADQTAVTLTIVPSTATQGAGIAVVEYAVGE